MKLEDAKKAYDVASAAYDAVCKERDAEIEIAKNEISKKYAERANATGAAQSEAAVNLDTAKREAAKSNPLNGKRIRRNTAYQNQTPVYIYAIVESYDGSQYYEIRSRYNRRGLDHGQLLARLLKKDGTPGKRIDILYGNWDGANRNGWHLYDE